MDFDKLDNTSLQVSDRSLFFKNGNGLAIFKPLEHNFSLENCDFRGLGNLKQYISIPLKEYAKQGE